MNMKMGHFLAAVIPDIGENPVAPIAKSQIPGDLAHRAKQD